MLGEKRQGLLLDLLVKLVAQVRDDAQSDGAHQNVLSVVGQPLEQKDRDDGKRNPFQRGYVLAHKNFVNGGFGNQRQRGLQTAGNDHADRGKNKAHVILLGHHK